MNLRAELGSGPLSADLWVIGRDYGREEAAAKQPFVGSAGRTVLNPALEAAGFRRGSVRVDNLVPMKPPGNDFSEHDPTEVEWGKLRLTELLRNSKPKLTIALGNEVSEFLLGDLWPRDKRGKAEGIQNLRGYLWDTAYGRVLTTVHPAGILRDWTPWRALLDLDFRKAKRELLAGCPVLEHREVTIVTEPEEVDELWQAIAKQGLLGRGGAGLLSKSVVKRLAIQGAAEERLSSHPYKELREQLERKLAQSVARGCASGVSCFATSGQTTLVRGDQPGEVRLRVRNEIHGQPCSSDARMAHRRSASLANRFLSVDIENTEDLKLACVGFAPSERRAWVIPAIEGWQLEAIVALCKSAVPKVLQNGQYDRFFTRRFCGFEIEGQTFDTQLAWHALQPELAGKKTQLTKRKGYSRRTVKSLKFLASIYTRDGWYKDYQFESEEDRYILCGRDCTVTHEIAQKLAKQLAA